MTSLYESLIVKLANVVELATQEQGSNLTPQAKQALVRVVRASNKLTWRFASRVLLD